MKKILPNIFTAINLVFGMCSIIETHNGNFLNSAVFILFALISDGLDGRIARAFGSVSNFGKEIDSLCDLGSFGIAPAFLAHAFCMDNYGILGISAVIIFVLSGMLRLARFNTSSDSSKGFFVGLPIPAGGCIIATTTLLFISLNIHPEKFGLVYPLMILIISYLMISHIHYPNFKTTGEKIFIFSKIFAVTIFLGIIYLTREVIISGMLAAIFLAYIIFGIINSLLILMYRD